MDTEALDVSSSEEEGPAQGHSRISRLYGWATRLLKQSADEWNLAQPVMLVIALVPCFLVGLSVFSGAISKELFKFFLAEDGVFENLQAICLVGCAGLSIVLARRLRKAGRHFLAALYLVLFLGLLFIVGEEISWGQRIFGWQTPESWVDANRQGETNIHNLFGINQIFRLGQLFVGLFGTLAPLYIFHRVSREDFRRYYSYFVPHFALIPYFLVVLIWRAYRTFFPPAAEFYFAIARFNEAVELIIYLAGLLFLYYHFRRRNDEAIQDHP